MTSSGAPVRAVTFDAYGTLVRNEDLRTIHQRIIADHSLSLPVDDLWHAWADLYYEATQQAPFRNLRAIEADIFSRLFRELSLDADVTPYVEMYFEVTTRVELYPETLEVLNALAPVRAAILSKIGRAHV